MQAEDARDRMKELARRYTSPGGGTWAEWLPYWPWAQDLMARLVVLVGDQEILWTSGEADNEQGGNAYLVLFTAGAFVEGGYGPRSPDGPSRVWLRATGWQVVRRLRIEEIGPSPKAGTAWPAHLRAELDVDTGSGTRSVYLPVDDVGMGALTAFLPRLAARLSTTAD